MNFNAEHALFNGHRLFGYKVDGNKKYIIDDTQAPIVHRIFTEYADGKPLVNIVSDINNQGVRTSRNVTFSINTVNKMLKNRAYIGEYHFGDYVIPGGMPAIIDTATFDMVQKRLAKNKRIGSHRRTVLPNSETPRYWLTGKLFCGECGSSMQGVSGTSKTKAKHYYYYCKGQRMKRCHKKPVKKDWIETVVMMALSSILNNTENVASIAVDAADYYKKNYHDTGYLDSLEAKRREVEKGIANFVKAIEAGIFNDATQKRMIELQEEMKALTEAIEAENIRQVLYEDEHSIQAYFDKYLHANLNDPETRDAVLDYFVDKIYLYDDKIVITAWYSANTMEIPYDIVDDVVSRNVTGEFTCPVKGSTTVTHNPYYGNRNSLCASGGCFVVASAQ